MNASRKALTAKQWREVEYHRQHLESLKPRSDTPCYEPIESTSRRWWNHTWSMYDVLLNADLAGKTVLVVGCGFGSDALLLSKLGAKVYAFDLSPEVLQVASERAQRAGLSIAFEQMAAENLQYGDDLFDCIVARDILHHVDIPLAMTEIMRVARPGAVFVATEVYSHSFVERIRRSRLVDAHLYPLLANYVYAGRFRYITRDERKLTNEDVISIKSSLADARCEYYYAVVTRLIPDTVTFACKLDRILLKILSPAAHALGSRILLTGRIAK